MGAAYCEYVTGVMNFLSSMRFSSLFTSGSAAYGTGFSGRFKSRCDFSFTAAFKLPVKSRKNRLSISSVRSLMALWVRDFDTALQTKLSGMSRRPSGSIKSSPKRLCWEFEMYMIPDAVFSSILIVIGSSPVIWTQSPEVLRATCLVDVSWCLLVLFHSFWEIRVMSDAVSICNRTGWLFSSTDTYLRFEFELGRNVATRLFVFYVCFCFVVACVLFCAWWCAESIFVTLPVAFVAAVSFERAFPSKMPATTIPASRWRFLLCCFRRLLSLDSVDCGCCCWYRLLYHIWIILVVSSWCNG